MFQSDFLKNSHHQPRVVEVSLKTVERSVSSAKLFALAFGCEPISGGRSPVTVVRLGSRNHAAHCTVNTV